ncbi:4-hydroxythreonine-4-phosphate dehydrogenase PdxA [Rhodococcus qingshengii]|uniref:PdxA family dehydrogenase n=1 Tax=Nocardiaceae TaxID=85025 RepID=UPI001AE3CB01|nr:MULTISPECIES: 4-hydroxythreonine-4-phosphate dehydrogenase PdxA [Rhodococcus]MBP1054830.1 4-hydroxythreonine-4-phosphate dehydrogenase PdxA [Rhodococcus qingshengii]MBP2527380.1 4-hydroxythreonine-4-phosphate dehydrogenase [Rhodococcus sp. PvP104]WQH31232.1 4-hydroxythreonine-4-phosphate dehydrogenase PdxA [Rhodococcus fascians]
MTGANRLLLSIGDPNGSGADIAAAAVAELGAAAPVVVGDRHVFAPSAERQGLAVRDAVPGAIAEPGVCDFVDTGALKPTDLAPGKVTAAAGAATIVYVTEAVRLAASGDYAGVVACPHSETAVHQAGIEFAGYPPLVAELTGTPEDEVFLMLIGGGMRIAHVTLHEQLSESIAKLTPDRVVTAGVALNTALRRMGIKMPTIQVFGINPHASEGGLFGGDDARVTEPAVAKLRELGIDAVGPTGADVVLGGAREADGYLAMYHDQGHIPIKTVAGRDVAAVTIGAGVSFSSVGHGPVFGKAGLGTADPSAVLSALRLLAPSGRKD